MATQVNISSIVGTPPYNIWVCDNCGSNQICTYIDYTVSNSFSFTLPSEYENLTTYCIKIIDSKDCTDCICIT